ncbi:hypothetical protein ACS0TY_017679 [Phlomoides rotata]
MESSSFPASSGARKVRASSLAGIRPVELKLDDLSLHSSPKEGRSSINEQAPREVEGAQRSRREDLVNALEISMIASELVWSEEACPYLLARRYKTRMSAGFKRTALNASQSESLICSGISAMSDIISKEISLTELEKDRELMRAVFLSAPIGPNHGPKLSSDEQIVVVVTHVINMLVSFIETSGGLKTNLNTSVGEQVVIFLSILAHHTKNRIVKSKFLRSGRTVSKYFHRVLNVIIRLHQMFLAKPELIGDDCTDHRWRMFKYLGYSY